MPRRTRLVTLTTDLGNAYAAQMKGVLLGRVPPGHVVDIAHDLPAHGVEEAAFLLSHIGAAFPAGTVHVAVVDPGVGGSRAPLAIRCADGSLLVGPDNGVLAPLARRLGRPEGFRLDAARVRPGGAVSPTFEGRDLFAPAAAQLATGTAVERLGSRAGFLAYELPTPLREGPGARGEIAHVDRFGNAITNIPNDWFPTLGAPLRVRVGRKTLELRRRRTYSEIGGHGLAVLGSSFGTLELSAREARASDRLRLRVGSPIRIGPLPARPTTTTRRDARRALPRRSPERR